MYLGVEMQKIGSKMQKNNESLLEMIHDREQ
jgi:hypothetical protein